MKLATLQLVEYSWQFIYIFSNFQCRNVAFLSQFISYNYSGTPLLRLPPHYSIFVSNNSTNESPHPHIFKISLAQAQKRA
jgi:hypothetical protein